MNAFCSLSSDFFYLVYEFLGNLVVDLLSAIFITVLSSTLWFAFSNFSVSFHVVSFILLLVQIKILFFKIAFYPEDKRYDILLCSSSSFKKCLKAFLTFRKISHLQKICK